MIKSLLRRLLPSSTRGRIERVARRTASELFDGELPSLDWSLRNLRRLGLDPRRVVDVGAYHGEWTRQFKKVFPDAQVLMVEAQQGKEARLAAVCGRFPGSVEYSIALLGAEEGRRVVFQELETGSSVFEERSDVPRRSVELTTTTLDREVARRGLTGVDFLKLDVQGYEVEVLTGGARALDGCSAVLVETSLIEINRGAPLLAEFLRFMQRHGFVAYDICSLLRRPLDGALCQVDMVFVPEDSPLRESQRFA